MGTQGPAAEESITRTGQKGNLSYLNLVRSVFIGTGLIGAASYRERKKNVETVSAGRGWGGEEISA